MSRNSVPVAFRMSEIKTDQRDVRANGKQVAMHMMNILSEGVRAFKGSSSMLRSACTVERLSPMKEITL